MIGAKMAKSDKRKTIQKKAIQDVLVHLDYHPTATMLSEELQNRGYRVSRATVFRVLSDAADEGLISRIQLSGEDVRYDCNTKQHYHLHCRACGKIEDYALPYMRELDEIESESGFMIESHHIEFVGLCRECRLKGTEE